MLAHPTVDLLHALGLHGMAKGYQEIAAHPEARALDHAEWLGLLLEPEGTLPRQKRVETRARAAAPSSQRRGRRLPHASRARSGPVPEACGLRLDPQSAQFADHWAMRGRQKLARLRARTQGLPGGPLGPVLPRAAPVYGAGSGPRRRALRQALAPARPGQPAHSRRLGPRAAVARAGARSPGDRGGSLRCRLAPDHEPGAGRPLVRHHWHSDARRCRARSRGAQRLSDRTLRREPAQTQGARTSGTSGRLTFPSGIMIIHHDPRDGVALAAFKSEWWPASRRNSGRLQDRYPRPASSEYPV